MRSLLFVPGDSERKLAKSLSFGADGLIFDLEDSVAAAQKPAARAMTRAFILAEKGRAGRPKFYVRVNSLDTDFLEEDLKGVMGAGPDGVMLPKPRSGEDVNRLSIALHHAEEQAGLERGVTRIIPIVTELPISILQMPTYIGASTRLEALNWGMEDLSAELGASSTRDEQGAITSPFRLARDLTLYTSIAAGVAALDAVDPNFQDLDTLKRECIAAARDGFSGKAAIHPSQVAVINAAFTPSATEIAHANELVALFAANPGAGVVSRGGQMIDKPHLKKAERVLARAKAAGIDA